MQAYWESWFMGNNCVWSGRSTLVALKSLLASNSFFVSALDQTVFYQDDRGRSELWCRQHVGLGDAGRQRQWAGSLPLLGHDRLGPGEWAVWGGPSQPDHESLTHTHSMYTHTETSTWLACWNIIDGPDLWDSGFKKLSTPPPLLPPSAGQSHDTAAAGGNKCVGRPGWLNGQRMDNKRDEWTDLKSRSKTWI